MKRNLWPYAIILVFVLFATYIISFVVRSMQSDIELVSEDYYAQEIAYQSEIDKLERTNTLGNGFNLSYLNSSKSINLTFPDTLKLKTGRIHFYRPSDSKLDFELKLGDQSKQTVDVRDITKGLWQVKLDFSSDANIDYYFEREIFIK